AVNGDAFGGGFNLAQSCDLCVAADTARFAIPEAKWGRGMDWAALLPRTVPARVAMELMLTARPIDAARAERVGLVNAVVSRRELLPATIELASAIAANAERSVRAAKALVWRSIAAADDELTKDATTLFRDVYRSRQALEGPRRFASERSKQHDEPDGGSGG
ncbi:MAG TPA: enoyl-CoA hydratase-related protein, partial [Acidimicrobiales bacterium]